MEEIIEEKMKQVKTFSERLSKFAKGTIFAESTYDDFWGTGLDRNGTDHTQEGKWPGKNHLGRIIQKVAGVRKCHQRSWSCPKNLCQRVRINKLTYRQCCGMCGIEIPVNVQETSATHMISPVARTRPGNGVKALGGT